jgi:hypothetical protein
VGVGVGMGMGVGVGVGVGVTDICITGVCVLQIFASLVCEDMTVRSIRSGTPACTQTANLRAKSTGNKNKSHAGREGHSRCCA